ncbi:MAG TPA: N-acetylmuramoyl-L-alanine amidase [Lachnospiraceae bacterium]|nr:N-acetylmuramoyl-L-alanine amidase [Lachnospiraceae bacterium]
MNIKTRIADKSNFTVGRTKPIQYIVIHYTANNGDTAQGNANYFNSADRNASAHYFVDENEIYQVVKDSDTALHCGASKYIHAYCRNNNSIGIEMCSRKDSAGNYYIKEETIKNAIEITMFLMKKYGVPIGNILRHYDVTGKNCPEPFVRNENLWQQFKEGLGDDEMVETSKIIINGKEVEVKRILKDGTNFIAIRDIANALGYKISSNGNVAVLSK